jgi:FkbM family methyltransferase
MFGYERMASALIGTRWQRPAERVRDVGSLWQRWRHPELREILDESRQIGLLLDQAITPDMNCVDVGCHLGSMLSEMVRRAPRGRHIAIEPVPYKAEWLCKKFPQVEVRQVALSDTEGRAEFFISSQSSGHSGLRFNHSAGNATKIDVALMRLDNVVPADRRIGFLKIDVEGLEYPVFRGAARILTENRPVVLFECTQAGLDNSGGTAEQLHSWLTQDVGYEIYLIKDRLAGAGPLDATSFAAAMQYPFRAFNFVAAAR